MSYTLEKKERFNSCQATETTRTNEEGDEIIVFYSYQCPELVKIGFKRFKFTYENSRKAGEKTGSRTTSKQLTQYRGKNWRELPTINLKDFEDNFFYTGINGLY